MKFFRLLPLLLLAACAADDPSSQDYALSNGSAESVGVVRLLNSSEVDFTTLDVDVALDRRAARNLINRRNGADGVFGTADDSLYTDIEEVDAVSYIGSSALAKLLSYADANGYLPGPNEVAGRYDDVTVTFAEQERILESVNAFSSETLDDDVDLDRRAVASIVEARPIMSMRELSELYYVGKSALTKLKAYDAPVLGRQDCRNNTECETGQRCQGIPFDGSSEFGKCAVWSNVPGAGRNCGVSEPCMADLFCGGLTFGDVGMCIADWQQDTFENTESQAFARELLSSVVVRGQASVPYDITVDLNLEHENPQNLRITLYDPNGTDALLWDGPTESGPFPGSFIAMGSISRDDTVNGRWQLEIVNVNRLEAGQLTSWALWLSSNFD